MMSARRQQCRAWRTGAVVAEDAAAVLWGGTGTVGVKDALCNQRDRARGDRDSQS